MIIFATALTLLLALGTWGIASGRHVAAKALIAFSIPVWAFAAWRYMASADGWPIGALPPAKASLVAVTIDEPNPGERDPGHIYVWLLPDRAPGALDYRPDAGSPRAYALPYSRELHKRMLAARQMLAKGEHVGFARAMRQGGTPNGGYRIYRLPQAQAPTKPPGG